MSHRDALNPWLALDAATPPAPRVRELRRDWERFLTGGGVNGRSPIRGDGRSTRESIPTGAGWPRSSPTVPRRARVGGLIRFPTPRR
jgi:hypothetical protein